MQKSKKTLQTPAQLKEREGITAVDKDIPAGRDDRQLMAAIARGDNQDFTEFVSRHINSIIDFAVRNMGRRTDAEDIAQQALTRVWVKAVTWEDQNLPPLNWLYRITYNLCIDALRKRKPEVAIDNDASLSPELVSAESPEADVYHQELTRQVDLALQQLPERQHSAIILCAYQGLSNIDAASVMDISIEALESLLGRGRRKLRESLQDVR